MKFYKLNELDNAVYLLCGRNRNPHDFAASRDPAP